MKIHLPEVVAVLNQGVSDSGIYAFEEKTELKLPEDVRESFLIHNGHEEVYPGAIVGEPLDPLESVQGSVLFQQQICAEYDESDGDDHWDTRAKSFPVDAIHCRSFNGRWVAMGDWDSNCYGIDLDPGPNGVVGQVINFGRDEEEKYVLAQSWAHFLEDIVDELEAGNLSVIRDGEGEVQSFGRSGEADQAMYKFWKEWSMAKLPTAFQEIGPAKLTPIFPGEVIKDDNADAARKRVEKFVRDMHDFEQRWLEIRPIHELGFGLVSENQGTSYMTDGLKPGTFTPTKHFVTHEERFEQLKLGTYARRAIRQYRKILAAHCTDRKRSGNGRFKQQFPPCYDVTKDVVAEVRRTSADTVLVYLKPIDSRTTRYHLNCCEDQWRIDFKDVTFDHCRFRRIPLLFG